MPERNEPILIVGPNPGSLTLPRVRFDVALSALSRHRDSLLYPAIRNLWLQIQDIVPEMPYPELFASCDSLPASGTARLVWDVGSQHLTITRQPGGCSVLYVNTIGPVVKHEPGPVGWSPSLEAMLVPILEAICRGVSDRDKPQSVPEKETSCRS